MNDQYVLEEAVSKEARKNRSRVIGGGILSVFLLLSIVLSITDDELRKNLLVYVLLLIPSVLLWFSGYKGKRLIETANRYNAIFLCDSDGYVTISELSKQTGKEPAAIVSELDRLLDKGVLCRCTLVKEGQPCVILAGAKANEAGFVHVQCASCGGTTRIRAGSSGKCEYCGRELKA